MVERQPYQVRMAQAWMQFKGQMQLILSGDDYTAKELVEYPNSHAEWAFALGQPSLDRLEIPGVDHTFFSATARAMVENETVKWIESNRERFDEHK